MEAIVIASIVAAMVYMKAFRYMAVVLLMATGAYQASLFTSLTMQPHLIIALALGTLVGTLLLELIMHKPAKKAE